MARSHTIRKTMGMVITILVTRKKIVTVTVKRQTMIVMEKPHTIAMENLPTIFDEIYIWMKGYM